MSDFHFLYRQDKGRIDRATWWKAVLPLLVIWAGAIALYQWLGHFSLGDASQIVLHDAEGNVGQLHKLGDGSILIFPATVLTVISFVIGASFYFVSAKRFQDMGRAGMLASLLPLVLFFTAASHWMAPQLEGFPRWISIIFDLAALAVTVWTVGLLGFKESA